MRTKEQERRGSKEDKREKGKKVEKTKSKVDNSSKFVPSYKLLQILSNEPACSKYLDDEDVCSSGAETTSIRALSVGPLFECEEPRSGFPQPPSKGESEEFNEI